MIISKVTKKTGLLSLSKKYFLRNHTDVIQIDFEQIKLTLKKLKNEGA